MEETLYDRRDALQGREGDKHRASPNVGSGQCFCENVAWWFLIEPNVVQRFTLKLLTTGGVGFESDDGHATGDVINPDGVQEVGNAPSRYKFSDCILRDCARAFLSCAAD
jgi:hypothetical protein